MDRPETTAALAQQRLVMDGMAESLRAELDTVRTENSRHVARIAELETQLTSQRTVSAEASRLRDAALAEAASTRRAAQQESERIPSQWEGNERHWLKQIDETRNEIRRILVDREREQLQLQRRLDELQSLLITEARQTHELRKARDKDAEALVKERERRVAAEAELVGLRRVIVTPRRRSKVDAKAAKSVARRPASR